MSKIGEPIVLNEEFRSYMFPGGDTITLNKVNELVVRPSGSHRIKTDDGLLHVISAGWLAISIKDENGQEWTV